MVTRDLHLKIQFINFLHSYIDYTVHVCVNSQYVMYMDAYMKMKACFILHSISIIFYDLLQVTTLKI